MFLKMSRNASARMSSARFLILSVFWLTGHCYGQKLTPLRLEVEPTDQHAVLGDNVTIQCVWNSIVSNCFWMKDDVLVNLQGNSRYVMVNHSENCSLTILGVQRKDEGRWMCGISDRIPLSSKDILLSVNTTAVELPKREVVIHPLQQTVIIENAAILRCEFSIPSQRCFWLKNGDIVVIAGRYSFIGDVASGNCSIEIIRARHFDDGIWQCGYPRTDSNQLLASKKASLTVIVMPSEPIIVVNGMKVKNGSKLYVPYTSLPQQFSISCWSENGKPASKLEWGFQSESTVYSPVGPSHYDHQYQTKSYESPDSKPLQIAHLLLFYGHVTSYRNQHYLVCSAYHPTYAQNHTTSLQLIVSNQRSPNYYG